MTRRSLLLATMASLLVSDALSLVQRADAAAGESPPEEFAAPDTLWQWSVPAPTVPDRRAFLWIPPKCQRVRGLVVACHNMLEQPLFERPAFRAACAANDLGLVLIFPGHDRDGATDDGPNAHHPQRSALDIFLNPDYPNGAEDPLGAGADLQKVLDALADESGYEEIRHAPLMPVGHSSAGSFVWHLYRWDPKRLFAMLPLKTAAKNDGPEDDIPILMIESEWFDFGDKSNNVWSGGSLKGRADGKCLFGYYVDLGSGHCNVSDDSMAMLRLWLNTVVALRIPAEAPLNAPVALKPLRAEDGWLIEAATIGRPSGKVVAYTDYSGDKALAYWYPSRAVAEYVQTHMAAQLAKKPQQVNFLADSAVTGTPEPVGGTYRFSPRYLDDQGTFRVTASFLDTFTRSDLYPPDTKLGNSGMPIRYRVTSGAAVQVGLDTFRIRPHAGPLRPQGNPWDPTLVAYTLGNDAYRPTERPAHINVSIVNTAGATQTLTFPEMLGRPIAAREPVIPLTATASSGLPVQYFVVSGPVELTPDGHGLRVRRDLLPPRTVFPVRVLVGAYQWGRPVAPQIQSVGPVVREFFLPAPPPAARARVKPALLLPLPDPLKMQDGTRVTTPSQWEKQRRPELSRMFADNLYGRTLIGRPDALRFVVREIKPDARNGKATRLRVAVLFEGTETGRQMEMLVYLPNQAAAAPVPVFLGLNFDGNFTTTHEPDLPVPNHFANGLFYSLPDHRTRESQRGNNARMWPYDTILARGYGVATACYGEIEPDLPHQWEKGPRGLAATPGRHDWGALGAWAWALSRALDYLQTHPRVDAQRVALFGFSRLGKTAMWAAAQDERFAAVVSQNSGKGGVSLSKHLSGEPVAHLAGPDLGHWFAPAYGQYADHEAALPVDGHELAALVAPRPLLILSGAEDAYSDPEAEFLSGVKATPVYRLLDSAGLTATRWPAPQTLIDSPVGYYLRPGGHNVTSEDWAVTLDWADTHLAHSAASHSAKPSA